MELSEKTRRRLESSDWNSMLLREFRALMVEATGDHQERRRLTEELERTLPDQRSKH